MIKKLHYHISDVIVVIVVVLFLAALSISLIKNKSSSSSPKAIAAIKAIVAAIKNYESVYGALPCEENVVVKLGDKNRDQYDKLMEILTGIDGPDNDGEATSNSRNINFLYTFDDYKADGWVDEWKSRFNIILNSRKKQSVTIGNKTIHGSISVYSSGPNRKDENGGGDDAAQ